MEKRILFLSISSKSPRIWSEWTNITCVLIPWTNLRPGCWHNWIGHIWTGMKSSLTQLLGWRAREGWVPTGNWRALARIMGDRFWEGKGKQQISRTKNLLSYHVMLCKGHEENMGETGNLFNGWICKNTLIGRWFQKTIIVYMRSQVMWLSTSSVSGWPPCLFSPFPLWNMLPQMQWLKTTQIYDLTVLELKSKNQGVGSTAFLLEATVFLAFSCFLSCLHSLAWRPFGHLPRQSPLLWNSSHLFSVL